MHVLAAIVGVLLIFIVLWDGFETVVLPRRVTGRFRLVRLFYRSTWTLWRGLAGVIFIRSIKSPRRFEDFLGFYGPLSLPLLLGFWAFILISGYTLIYWSLSSMSGGSPLTGYEGGLLKYFYYSGSTFFTLGIGDITPRISLARGLTMLEAGMGFGFLAIVIAYLPVLNQSFLRREVNVSRLSTRAGIPPTAGRILARHVQEGSLKVLENLLLEWEHWSAEFHETHLSYPVLAYFRSHHENESWLAALTSTLDTCAFSIAAFEGPCKRQARLTFSIARHSLKDLSIVLHCPPAEAGSGRLRPEVLGFICTSMERRGMVIKDFKEVESALAELCGQYEPYIISLSRRFRLPLPPWFIEE